jgi:hypothetical protein
MIWPIICAIIVKLLIDSYVVAQLGTINSHLLRLVIPPVGGPAPRRRTNRLNIRLQSIIVRSDRTDIHHVQLLPKVAERTGRPLRLQNPLLNKFIRGRTAQSILQRQISIMSTGNRSFHEFDQYGGDEDLNTSIKDSAV